VHAANRREAVETAAREHFDLIFIEGQIPGMDVFEATRRIRKTEDATGRHTPIAAMTAHAMAGDRERCLAAGFDHYISRPLQKAELLGLLSRMAKPASSAWKTHAERPGESLSTRSHSGFPLDANSTLPTGKPAPWVLRSKMRMTTLIADDDDITRLLLSSTLRAVRANWAAHCTHTVKAPIAA